MSGRGRPPHEPVRGRVIARDGDDALVRTARGDVRVRHAGAAVAGDLVRLDGRGAPLERVRPYPHAEYPPRGSEVARLGQVRRGNLAARSRLLAAVREVFAARDFLEVETPQWVRAPGLEVHLVAVPAGAGADAGYLVTSPEYQMKRLLASFEHYVELERDKWLAFVVGPENPDFVPLAEVSPHLLNSFMTTEDSAFYQHKGFIVREFRTALIKNLAAGYFKYGASSITMQTVKNVLLYREKTLSRKLQELFLTYSIEQVLDKDRIFEIYVNAIEYGPGLYGIGPAARHYFGKAPRDLTPTEAAFFSSILPSPKARYRQYCKGTLTRWTDNKIDRILALMRKRGRLTEDEYQAAVAQPLVFVKDGTETEDQCMKRVSRALKNARPTNPLKK